MWRAQRTPTNFNEVVCEDARAARVQTLRKCLADVGNRYQADDMADETCAATFIVHFLVISAC